MTKPSASGSVQGCRYRYVGRGDRSPGQSGDGDGDSDPVEEPGRLFQDAVPVGFVAAGDLDQFEHRRRGEADAADEPASKARPGPVHVALFDGNTRRGRRSCPGSPPSCRRGAESCAGGATGPTPENRPTSRRPGAGPMTWRDRAGAGCPRSASTAIKASVAANQSVSYQKSLKPCCSEEGLDRDALQPPEKEDDAHG